MTIYEKNLKTLSKYYPKMDMLIRKAAQENQESLNVIEDFSNEGERILKVEKEGKIYYLNGKRNTTEPAQAWFQTLGTLEKNAPILLIGIGNETYFKELAEKAEKRLTIVIYEPSLTIFVKFLEQIDLESYMEKHLIIFLVNGLRGMELKNIEGVLNIMMEYEKLPYFRQFVLPNYEVLFTKEIVEFTSLCRDAMVRSAIKYNTKNIFTVSTTKNILCNMVFLLDGYKTTQLVEVIPRNIPGILVAAGPSLNKNIQELKKAKGKAFIIAVDTAIKPLLNAGIIPDMFAIVDAQKPVELVAVEEAKNIPLLTNLNAASEVLKYHTGKKFFYDEEYNIAEDIFIRSKKRFGTVNSGGSVATNAFSLLYKIGLDTVILVGQDLAYTNNRSHADGTFHEKMEEEDTSHFLKVEGNYEKEVPTRRDFQMFLKWYNMYIEGCKEHRSTFRVINATEGGAKIKNTEIMTLREAIEQECVHEVNIEECLNQLPPMLDKETREWAEVYLCEIPDKFSEVTQKAKQLKNIYKKLDRICNKKNIDKKEYLSILKKLEKKIEEIESIKVYQFVTYTLNNAQYILRAEQFMQEDSIQKEGKEIARKGILYMNLVADCAKMFEEYSRTIFTKEQEK